MEIFQSFEAYDPSGEWWFRLRESDDLLGELQVFETDDSDTPSSSIELPWDAWITIACMIEMYRKNKPCAKGATDGATQQD